MKIVLKLNDFLIKKQWNRKNVYLKMVIISIFQLSLQLDK